MHITPEMSIQTHIFFSFSYILMSYSKYSMATEFKQEVYFGIIRDDRKLGLLFERLPQGANDLATQSMFSRCL